MLFRFIVKIKVYFKTKNDLTLFKPFNVITVIIT